MLYSSWSAHVGGGAWPSQGVLAVHACGGNEIRAFLRCYPCGQPCGGVRCQCGMGGAERGMGLNHPTLRETPMDTNTARRDGGEALFWPRLGGKSPGQLRRQEGEWPLGGWTRTAVPRAVGIGD